MIFIFAFLQQSKITTDKIEGHYDLPKTLNLAPLDHFKSLINGYLLTFVSCCNILQQHFHRFLSVPSSNENLKDASKDRNIFFRISLSVVTELRGISETR